MHSSQSPSPQLGKSTYSSGARRDVLWNVLEPGDPYDIRKSMIAKLPGDKEHFMGDNLEIVCLFQSAQIQRLCQFLDDYKFRYRQIQRRELDRHSYEVQIKQLTQQLTSEGSLRSENNKLKEFIKKQTAQIQQLKNSKYHVDNNLRANYQSALVQIQTLRSENTLLKSEKQKLIIQINNYLARIEALESTRQKQLKDLYNKYAQQNKYALENQTKSMKLRFQSEISRLQFEIKRLKQFNDAKNSQINDLNSKNRSLLIQIQELESRKGRPDPAYVAQMQQRFALMGMEIQRLNLRIKESTSKIDESARNELYWKDKYSRMQQDYRSLEIRYKQINEQYTTITVRFQKLQSQQNSNQSSKYQDQIKRLNAQIRRLEQQRTDDAHKYSTLEKRYSELEYSYTKISVIQRENAELKSNQSNIHDLKRKIAEYETKIALLSQQIQRLTSQAKSSSYNKQDYEDLKSQFQQFKRRSTQRQRSLSQRYQSQMQRKVLQYESRLAKYAQQSGNQFQIRLQAINRQVQRLNQYLKQKTQQSQNNKKRIRQLQNSINQKYQIEVTRNNASYEATIKELKNQNEELNRRLREFDNVNRKIAEYQNKIALFTQEIQRLNFGLKGKIDQLDNLRRVNKELEQKVANARATSSQDIQITRKISIYQENQYKLTRQNDDLKRRLQEVVELNRRLKEYEDRIRGLSQENERLNQNLKQKIEALNRSELNLRNLTQQIQQLRRNRYQIQSSFSQKYELQKMENSRKFTNYEQSLSSIQRQYEQLRRKMMNMGNDSNKKVNEYENKIVLLSQQIERLNQSFRIKISDYENAIQGLRNQLEVARRQNKQLQINITQRYELQSSRKISIYQQNISGLTRQLQQLRRKLNQYQNSIRKKSEEISQLENRYRVVSQQYESFKFQVKSYEGEVTRSQSSYQQNLSRIQREYEQLKRRIAEYENKIALLSQENQRLNGMLRNGQQEQQNLRRAIQTLKIEITQKYQIQTSRKISNYEQNLSFLNKQKEQLRRKLAEYENLIANLRIQNQDKNRKIAEWQNKFRQLVQQNQGLNNKFRQLQITISQKYEIETSRKITTYEQNIQNLNRQLQNLRLKLNEYENMRVNYEKQINRLNMMLKNSTEEQEKLIMRMREIQTTVTHKYETEVTRQFTIYEQNISNLNVQIEDLKRKLMNADQIAKNQMAELEQLRRRLKQYGDMNRTVTQYENQFAIIRQELERVNINLKNKIEQAAMLDNKLRAALQENEDLKRKLKQVQISIVNKYQFEFNQKSTNYQQNIANMRRQHEELIKKLVEYENKIALTSQEVGRVNNMLKIKVEELNQSELRSRNWQMEIQNLRRKLMETEKSSTMRFQSEITRAVSIYQKNMQTLIRQYEEYKKQSTRRIAEFQTKVALLSQQLERASQLLRQRNDQFGQSDIRLKNAMQQIQKLQRAIRQLEQSSSKRFDSQKTTIISTYEQNILIITRQFEQLKLESNRKYIDYQNRIGNMNRQLQNLRRQLKQSQMQSTQRFQLQITRRISTYQQTISSLKLQLDPLSLKNKQLSRKIVEYQNKIALMSQQMQRLSSSLKQKSQQLLLLQQKYSSMQNQDGEYRQLQSSYSLVSKEYEASKKHLLQYEQSIRKLYSEFERLQVIINQLKGERQALFDKNHGLIREIQRLTSENKDQETQIYQLRLKFSDQVSLQKRINQHMALMVVLFAEIETLRQRVKDKQKQVQEVRRSSLAPLKA